MKMELRVNPVSIESNSDGSMTVTGYVNETGQKSKMLGRKEKFVETIAPGAFRSALDAGKDIHFLAEHDSSKILASTRNGSLDLVEDERGLRMSATICPTSWGKDYYELIDSGILQHMSFGFRSIKDTWKKVEGYFERTVNALELFEVSVVRDPAYTQSSISARGIDVVEDVEIPAELREEAPDQTSIKVEDETDLRSLATSILEKLNELTDKMEARKEDPKPEDKEDPEKKDEEKPEDKKDKAKSKPKPEDEEKEDKEDPEKEDKPDSEKEDPKDKEKEDEAKRSAQINSLREFAKLYR